MIMDDIYYYETFKLITKFNKQGTRFIFINPSFKHKFKLSNERMFKLEDNLIKFLFN